MWSLQLSEINNVTYAVKTLCILVKNNVCSTRRISAPIDVRSSVHWPIISPHNELTVLSTALKYHGTSIVGTGEAKAFVLPLHEMTGFSHEAREYSWESVFTVAKFQLRHTCQKNSTDCVMVKLEFCNAEKCSLFYLQSQYHYHPYRVECEYHRALACSSASTAGS